MASQQELERRAKNREIENNMPKKDLEEMGNMIKEFRKSHNLTQKELAKKLKIAESTMGLIEQGRRNISLELQSKLKDILGQDIFITFILEKIKENIDTFVMNIDEYDYVFCKLYLKFYKDRFNQKEIEDMNDKLEKLHKKLSNNGTAPQRINTLMKRLKKYISNLEKELATYLNDCKKNKIENEIESEIDYNYYFEMLNNIDKNSVITNYKIPVFDSIYLNKSNIYLSEIYGSYNISKDLFYDKYNYIGIFLTAPCMHSKLNYISQKYKPTNIITVRLSNEFYNNADVIISINETWYIKNIYKDKDKIIISNPCSQDNSKQEYTYKDIKELNIKIIGTIVNIYFNDTFIKDKDKFITL